MAYSWWYDSSMQTPSQIRLARLLGLTVIGISFPLLGWGVWQVLQFFPISISATTYIICSFAVAGGAVVLLLGSSIATYLPSKKDEQVARLLQAQREYLTLYEHSPVPYLTLNTDGRVKMLNLAAVRLFGTTTEAFIGMYATELFITTDDSSPVYLQSAILEHRSVSELAVQIQTERGEIRWVQATLLVFQNGRENLLALVDITKAKEIDAAKSEFVALATHQLRTPLAAIRWNTELLEQHIVEMLPPSGQNYLQKVKRNVVRMGDLINDFLSASQLEMGTFSTSEQTLNLVDFFDSVIEEFASRIRSGELEIVRSYTPPDAVMVSDPRLLHIIVSNLVSNAVKYTPDTGTVRIGYEVSGLKIVITVTDDGIGIPEAEQAKLFSKFFRAANAREKQTEGTGLGLYVVEQSVKKLHGRIEYHSAADSGTRFTVTLPYHSG